MGPARVLSWPSTVRWRIQALGAITISEQPLPKPDVETANAAFIAHLCADGFGPTGLADTIHEHVARVQQLRKLYGDTWPDWSVEALAKSSGTWLAGALDQRAFSIPSAGTLLHALKAQLDWPLPQDLDQKAPLTIALPSGRKARIDWLDERAPLLECKAQELYGAKQHLSVAEGRLPITLQILSPGGKPVATTRDLPNFWRGGYQDMVKDMRGRYPKHDWPDDPANAKPHAGMTKARLAMR